MFGRKRGDSKPVHERDARLIRFFPQSPTFLDDPQDAVSFLEMARKRLGPREVDKGRASYWEATSSLQQVRFTAQYAANQSKQPKRVTALGVARELVEAHRFNIEEARDPQAFECVADLHRHIDMLTPDAVDRFAHMLLQSLLSRDSQNTALFSTNGVTHQVLHKEDIRKALRRAATGCDNIDQRGLHDWLVQVIDSPEPPSNPEAS